MRREQRAAVWPYVEVEASLTSSRFEVRLRNVGVGPARVRAAAVSRDGAAVRSWSDLIRGAGVDPEQVAWYFSLARGRVLPRDSDAEVIFRLAPEDVAVAPDLIERLSREAYEGKIDVAICYCSVYDECWTSRLQDLVQRSRGLEAFDGGRSVESCDAAPRSAI